MIVKETPFVKACFSKKEGGYSPAPYASLNLAYHVGDDRLLVDKNRAKLLEKIQIDAVAYMEQIHGCHIEEVYREGEVAQCDGIITNKKGLGLMVMVADCIPILMYDKENEAIAVAHAGRNGTFLEIATKCVAKMSEAYGTKPEALEVYLGPSIKSCCYEVGGELTDIMRKNFGEQYVVGERYLDLQRLNEDMLRKVGVKNIHVSSVCTCCDENYFSYRREGVTGRFVGLIGLV